MTLMPPTGNKRDMPRKGRCRKTPWRVLSAVHEAGHAIAYWAFGVLPDSVELPRNLGDELVDSWGRKVICSGLTEASFFDHLFLPLSESPREVRGKLIKAAQIRAICDYAGPFAEARYRHASELWVLLTCGYQDFDHAKKVIRWVTTDPELVNKISLIVERAARRVISVYAPAIKALAKELEYAGRVEDERIDELAEAAMGYPIPKHGSVPSWLEGKLYREC
jgi:hypothetical protein